MNIYHTTLVKNVHIVLFSLNMVYIMDTRFNLIHKNKQAAEYQLIRKIIK